MEKSKLKKWKLAGIIIVIFIVVALIAWILLVKAKDSDPQAVSTPTVTATNSVLSQTPGALSSVSATVAAADWRNYSNSQYHFGLQFDQAWEGYTVAENQNLPQLAVANFAFKLNDGTPLTVYIFNQSDFESAKANFSSTEITKANGYAYSYRTWDSSPANSALTDKAIADVIKTFKTSN